MTLSSDQVEALVVALLAVNNYTIEKVWPDLPGLRAHGLTDPSWVAKQDLGVVVATLTASGHNRGMLAGMMAERLQTLMRAVVVGAFDRLPELLVAGRREETTRLLCSVKGIGPKVAKNALMLMES